jgi:hypothetical protein
MRRTDMARGGRYFTAVCTFAFLTTCALAGSTGATSSQAGGHQSATEAQQGDGLPPTGVLCRMNSRRVPDATFRVRAGGTRTHVRFQDALPSGCEPEYGRSIYRFYVRRSAEVSDRMVRNSVRTTVTRHSKGSTMHGPVLMSHQASVENFRVPRTADLALAETYVEANGKRYTCKTVYSRRGKVMKSSCSPKVGGYL